MKILKNREGASVLTVIGYIFAILLILFGLLNLYSLASPQAANKVGRIVVALICFMIGGGIIFSVIRRTTKTPDKMEVKVVQEIDLSGDVATEKLSCKNCGANLEQNSVKVKAGAVFINCPYCGSSYQITEEPKW
jgi:DNA-directed RNA polymerase subunit RPC12/RpoP